MLAFDALIRRSGQKLIVLTSFLFLILSLPGKLQGQREYFKQILIDKLGISKTEAEGITVSSYHRSTLSGLAHVYFQQYINGIKVKNAWASLHLNAANAPVAIHDQLVRPDIGAPAFHFPSTSEIAAALTSACASTTLPAIEKIRLDTSLKIAHVQIESSSITIPYDPCYFLDEGSKIHRGINFLIPSPDENAEWEIFVTLPDHRVLEKRNWVNKCSFIKPTVSAPSVGSENRYHQAHARQGLSHFNNSSSFNGQYNVFYLPIESPLYGTREVKLGTEIINATASPFGWHDTTGLNSPNFPFTRGNNVYAYYAHAGTSGYTPLAVSIVRDPVTGSYVSGNVPWPPNLEFNYNHSLSSTNGTDFIEDAVTNLFVWNNICHDVFFLYGFDEGAGNFQQKNYSGVGVGQDFVRARAQDASGANNAAFFTPPEPAPPGTNPPYMQMFLWNTALPDSILDGDFDNAIIVHEYAHGLTQRLVGGPATNACLNNFEQGGEGWSDYFGLMFTLTDRNMNGILEQYQLGEGIRSIGSYVLNDTANSVGIRDAYYSTIMDCSQPYCNDFTYADIANLPYPHGTGFLWCTMLWEMTWELINAYGFEPNIYNTSSTAGNIRAMKIVIEGLKLTPCNPTFPEMRDAILTANDAIYGGAGKELIWAAFARRGLGYSAMEGGIESFDTPELVVQKSVDKEQVETNDTLTYTLQVKNNHNTSLSDILLTDTVPGGVNVISISDNGTYSNGIITYPSFSLQSGESTSRTFKAIALNQPGTTTLFDEPVESATPSNFTPGGAWIVDGGYPNPATGSTLSWWHPNPTTLTESSLILSLTLDGSKNNYLSFWHWYDIEKNTDGGVIEILEGTDWKDLFPRIRKHTYSGFLFNQLTTPIGVPVPLNTLSGRRAFTGYSGGYVNTLIDLTGYSGNTLIRFRFASDEETNPVNNPQVCSNNGPGPGTNCDGWFLDDFKLYDLVSIQNVACVQAPPNFSDCDNITPPGTVYFQSIGLPIELLSITAIPHETYIEVKWTTLSEIDVLGLELQRMSGMTPVNTIAYFPSMNTENEATTYSWKDYDVYPHIEYYYRIKTINMDGSIEYSQYVNAQIIGKSEEIIYPNPATDIFYVRADIDAYEVMVMEIFDLNGKLITTSKLDEKAVKQGIKCDSLLPGCYIVKLSSNQRRLQALLIKK